jgi:AraC-like DNA-binding protein
MIRLNRAMRVVSDRRRWTDIAASAGYYDQSHLISEFHELVGITPGAWTRRTTSPALRW